MNKINSTIISTGLPIVRKKFVLIQTELNGQINSHPTYLGAPPVNSSPIKAWDEKEAIYGSHSLYRYRASTKNGRTITVV